MTTFDENHHLLLFIIALMTAFLVVFFFVIEDLSGRVDALCAQLVAFEWTDDGSLCGERQRE